MTTIMEGPLAFGFPAGCLASKYDDWAFYRNQFQLIAGGCKGIDILCVEDEVSWLIEVKDYRHHRRTKTIDIADELAIKVRDTLAGLATAAKVANDVDECRLARQSLAKKKPMASCASLGTTGHPIETTAKSHKHCQFVTETQNQEVESS
ncbi:MAG: hypothetical protein OXF56_08830 [Rhodobacteraceae bacterium]|nr:hypothetical protein [Paracoccaceae bacterium]